jgi:tetratricopeptide (TPR) repeat protein
LERHQTLRHAVQWSYDLLDDGERSVLDRCSVFAGGFDLAGAQAVTGSDDDFATLDVLDALVRKSLLVADHSSGRTRFSMLETIRQFAEEQLAATGNATEARTAHARHFAAREPDIMALWDSPRQREAYDWFSTELANLRTAFRWATDRGDLDEAATIATYAAFLGLCIENYEPIAWAEELIEPARTVDHALLAALYVMGAQCWMAGRTEEAVRYADAAQAVIGSGRGEVQYEVEGMFAGPYFALGQPDRAVEWCRAQLTRRRDARALIRATLVIALMFSGSEDEAMTAAEDLIAAAETTGNPYVLSFALLAYGLAFRDAYPERALDALRRGLVLAQDSANRANESYLAAGLARVESPHGDPLAALEYCMVAIRNSHNSGNPIQARNGLAVLAALFDRLGRYKPAATIAGFALSPFTGIPELGSAITHLREVLGEQVYESLAHQGETMTTAAMVTYAFDQIDQARAELDGVSK